MSASSIGSMFWRKCSDCRMWIVNSRIMLPSTWMADPSSSWCSSADTSVVSAASISYVLVVFFFYHFLASKSVKIIFWFGIGAVNAVTRLSNSFPEALPDFWHSEETWELVGFPAVYWGAARLYGDLGLVLLESIRLGYATLDSSAVLHILIPPNIFMKINYQIKSRTM